LMFIKIIDVKQVVIILNFHLANQSKAMTQ